MIERLIRIPAEAIYDRMLTEQQPLVVCAYDDEERCREILIHGSITFRELQERLPVLSKEEEIVFY